MRDSAHLDWPRVVATGALWTLVYNLIWGIAWFTFMRAEWEVAFAAVKRTSLWTGEVWFGWVLITVPLGVTIAAYSAGQRHTMRAGVLAAVVLCVLMTVGMFGWGMDQSFSLRVMALDSIVNLLAMLSASVLAGWSQRHLAPHSSNIVL